MSQIFLSKDANRQYQKFSGSDKHKIDRILEKLTTSSFTFSKKLKGEFEGLYAIRAWPYRITYIIESQKIFIVSIRHRQSAYKK